MIGNDGTHLRYNNKQMCFPRPDFAFSLSAYGLKEEYMKEIQMIKTESPTVKGRLYNIELCRVIY